MIRILLFCLLSLLSSPGLLLARDVFFYHNDNVGTPVAMTDSSGKVVWRAHDKPFGEEFQTTEAPEHNSRRFIGKEKDKETGLVYIGARYLDPASGRFLQPDPVGPVDPMTGKVNVEMLANPQRLNRYVYGLNNPYRYIDPDGKDAIYVHYNNYPVSTPFGKLKLGHAGVVAINPKTGTTKYFEFGRYGDEKGVVRGAPEFEIPDVEIGKNGLPTKDSLDKLYGHLSKNYGQGNNVSATYYEDSDYEGTIKYANDFKKKHSDYNPVTNNCKTFARKAAKVKKED